MAADGESFLPEVDCSLMPYTSPDSLRNSCR